LIGVSKESVCSVSRGAAIQLSIARQHARSLRLHVEGTQIDLLEAFNASAGHGEPGLARERVGAGAVLVNDSMPIDDALVRLDLGITLPTGGFETLAGSFCASLAGDRT
jgi:hypothetical protein